MLTSNMKEGWRLSVQSDFARMSLDILGKCVFGFEFNTIEAGDTTISSAFNVLSTGVNVTGQNILKRKMVYWFPFLRRFMEFCIVRDEANKIFSKLINQVSSVSLLKQALRGSRERLLFYAVSLTDEAPRWQIYVISNSLNSCCLACSTWKHEEYSFDHRALTWIFELLLKHILLYSL